MSSFPSRGCNPEDLPDLPPEHELAQEWNLYKREVARLVAQGHEGRTVLIKGGEVIGIWDTRGEALEAGYARFGVVPLMVKTIRAIEPILRIPHYYG
jgi:hypothetical protein